VPDLKKKVGESVEIKLTSSLMSLDNGYKQGMHLTEHFHLEFVRQVADGLELS